MDRLILFFKDKGDMASSLAIVCGGGKYQAHLKAAFSCCVEGLGHHITENHSRHLQASLQDRAPGGIPRGGLAFTPLLA